MKNPFLAEVPSLELCTKLYALSVKPEVTLFSWVLPKEGSPFVDVTGLTKHLTLAAPSIGQMWGWLPMRVEGHNNFKVENMRQTVLLRYSNLKDCTCDITILSDSVANVVAETIIYLIHNGYLKAENLK